MKVCPHCGKQYPDTMTLCSADATPLQGVDDPLLNHTLAGKYRIEKLIKRGGMGAVYRGKHVLMEKTVAIKVLRPSLAADPDVVARFSREAKAASRISHPHAVSVTDFGEAENGVVFLVMEYLDGRTQKEIIRHEGPMSLERVVEIIRQVAGALDAAHAGGVIHRDLKSDNIMLVRHNGDEWAKVLDFGIAKIRLPEGAHDPDLTAPDLVIGTPQYMSPEQCSEARTIDARSDVYSLGVIVFEMLAGTVPFTGESATSIMMKQVQEPPPSLLALRRDLPVGLEGVIQRALAKQPADRFQTASELSDALAGAAAGEAPAASAAFIAGQTLGAATVPNAPVANHVDDLDEVTVVRRHEPSSTFTRIAPEAELATFNPWKIIIPSIIALLVVFTGVFLLTRNSGQTPQTPNQSGLSVDPNAQPVEPAGSPTGEGERGMGTLPIPTPSASVLPPNANANANARSEVPATVVNVNFGGSTNQNTPERPNRNVNKALETASPRGNASPAPKPLATLPPLKTSPTEAPPKPKPSGTVDQPPN